MDVICIVTACIVLRLKFQGHSLHAAPAACFGLFNIRSANRARKASHKPHRMAHRTHICRVRAKRRLCVRGELCGLKWRRGWWQHVEDIYMHMCAKVHSCSSAMWRSAPALRRLAERYIWCRAGARAVLKEWIGPHQSVLLMGNCDAKEGLAVSLARSYCLRCTCCGSLNAREIQYWNMRRLIPGCWVVVVLS